METNASSKCPVCGKDTPHVHDPIIQGYMTKVERLNAKVAELEDWKANAMRFDETNLLLRKKVAEKDKILADNMALMDAKLNRANAAIEKCKLVIKQMLHAERMSCRPPETVQQAERKLDAIRWASIDAEEALAAIAEYQNPKGGE